MIGCILVLSLQNHQTNPIFQHLHMGPSFFFPGVSFPPPFKGGAIKQKDTPLCVFFPQRNIPPWWEAVRDLRGGLAEQPPGAVLVHGQGAPARDMPRRGRGRAHPGTAHAQPEQGKEQARGEFCTLLCLFRFFCRGRGGV